MTTPGPIVRAAPRRSPGLASLAIAGADAAYSLDDRRVRAAVVLFRDGRPVAEAVHVGRVVAHYRPGELALREAPALLGALARLWAVPDLLLVDGHGRAHPRRFGLACAVGRLADLPSIGVAKRPLVGRSATPPDRRGGIAAIVDGGEVVGAAVRTRRGVRPVYVSVGHAIELERAVEIVLACCVRFRLPEPLRAAHRLASRWGDPG